MEYKTANDTKKINTRDDNEHGYSLECDLERPPILLEKN